MRLLCLVAAGVTGCVLLVGCTPTVEAPPIRTTPAAASATPVPATTSVPASATPVPATTSAAASASSAAGRTFPDASGAIAVADTSGFVSPSGRILCGMYSSGVICTFPQGMNRDGVPSGTTVCPESYPDFDVNSMELSTTATYRCSGDPPAWPSVGSDDAAWSVGRGFPSIAVGGDRFLTLPYGQKLKFGRYLCNSETTGVTCVNLTSRMGFRVALAGVVMVNG